MRAFLDGRRRATDVQTDTGLRRTLFIRRGKLLGHRRVKSITSIISVTSCRCDSFFFAERLRCFSSTAQYFSVSLSYFFLASCHRLKNDNNEGLDYGFFSR